MIGGVIITHGELSKALLASAESIAGEALSIKTITVSGNEGADEIREALSRAVKEVDDGEGVLIFTDMFGGTPSNIALSFLKEGELEVVTGVNLPLIIKFMGSRADSSFVELLESLSEYGQKSIVLASKMLKGKV